MFLLNRVFTLRLGPASGGVLQTEGLRVELLMNLSGAICKLHCAFLLCWVLLIPSGKTASSSGVLVLTRLASEFQGAGSEPMIRTKVMWGCVSLLNSHCDILCV